MSMAGEEVAGYAKGLIDNYNIMPQLDIDQMVALLEYIEELEDAVFRLEESAIKVITAKDMDA